MRKEIDDTIDTPSLLDHWNLLGGLIISVDHKLRAPLKDRSAHMPTRRGRTGLLHILALTLH